MHDFRIGHLCLLLVLLLLLLFTACGQQPEPSSPTAPIPTPSPTVELEAVILTTPTGQVPPTLLAIPTQVPPTPTPTATPMVYLVESGDTLLGIAIQFDLSLEALLLANPGIRPELLQIGQAVIIPPKTEDEAEALTLQTPTPIPLTIRGLGFYRTPVDGLWCLGEVINDTDTAVQNVRLAVTLVDTEGNPTTLENWAARDLIPVGSTAPFGILFPHYPGEMASFQVRVISNETADRLESWHSELAIEVQQAGPSEGQADYQVSGLVVNTGTETAINVTIFVSLYDNENRITGFIQENLTNPILGGTQQAFELHLSPASPFTSHHSASVSGRRQLD